MVWWQPVTRLLSYLPTCGDSLSVGFISSLDHATRLVILSSPSFDATVNSKNVCKLATKLMLEKFDFYTVRFSTITAQIFHYQKTNKNINNKQSQKKKLKQNKTNKQTKEKKANKDY